MRLGAMIPHLRSIHIMCNKIEWKKPYPSYTEVSMFLCFFSLCAVRLIQPWPLQRRKNKLLLLLSLFYALYHWPHLRSRIIIIAFLFFFFFMSYHCRGRDYCRDIWIIIREEKYPNRWHLPLHVLFRKSKLVQ